MAGSVLFADHGAELELRREIRLSELWVRCESGFFTLEEFRELSALIAEVDGLRGSLCIDCAMLDRPTSAPTGRWATRTCAGATFVSAWPTRRSTAAGTTTRSEPTAPAGTTAGTPEPCRMGA